MKGQPKYVVECGEVLIHSLAWKEAIETACEFLRMAVWRPEYAEIRREKEVR